MTLLKIQLLFWGLLFSFITGSVCVGNMMAISPVFLDNQSGAEEDLQKLIDQALKNGKKVVFLEKNKKYRLYNQLDIRCSIEGNGAILEPMTNASISIKISEKDVTIKNLTITGSKLKMIAIQNTGVVFEGCEIVGHNYGTLIQLEANNSSFVNCKLHNYYQKNIQYAIKNVGNNPIVAFNLIGCDIRGGIRFVNGNNRTSGGYRFERNTITVDFSHATQSVKNQNDAIRLSGINDVYFDSNKFLFMNVNRGFKFTDYVSDEKNKKRSLRPTTDVFFANNTIIANSKNGKQLFDLYDGTGKITFTDNIIDAKGHTIIFEDKTTIPLNVNRELILSRNRIKFDFRVLYYRGGNTPARLSVLDNEFIYSRKEISFNTSRIGQEKSIELNHLFYARELDEFLFKNNKLRSEAIKTPFFDSYVLNVLNVKMSEIINNEIEGALLFTGLEESQIKFTNNTILKTNFANLIRITRHSRVKGGNSRIIIKDNNVKESRNIVADFFNQK
ncbi:hypothetical protein [Sphingobacterium chuzhouense]|uniref:Right handed beta helix domain-containing protein n=1 Tax=Sphingobacterium chuzhouense TaxID=1742264 RepID=A0ABR7XXM0_9SPHI|nr:hypothetical protein [Sphingobacterium chuzhouense]MBD1423772.1 hypothetical protein [Sphingobacterium chuzhouense]